MTKYVQSVMSAESRDDEMAERYNPAQQHNPPLEKRRQPPDNKTQSQAEELRR